MVEQKILGGSGDGGDGPEGGLRVGSGCFRGESDTGVMVVVSGVPLYVESGAVSFGGSCERNFADSCRRSESSG